MKKLKEQKQLKKTYKFYIDHTNQKVRTWIKAVVIILLIVVVAVCFVGLIIGTTLGTQSHNCHSIHSYLIPCNDQCVDPTSDNNNCNGCGNVCPEQQACVDSSCEFCSYNCSNDGDLCTLEPCNMTTGCTVLDCLNDGNACTTGSCDSETGCTIVDCSNDGNACTEPPCNEATGCTVVDCSSDPCTAGSTCNTETGCVNVCPVLLLNAPNSNFNTSYTNVKPARKIVGTVQLTSSSSITGVNVTLSYNGPDSSDDSIPCPGSLTGITCTPFDASTGVLQLTGTTTASNYQSAISGLYFTNGNLPTPVTLTFTFSIANTEMAQPHNVKSQVYVTGGS